MLLILLAQQQYFEELKAHLFNFKIFQYRFDESMTKQIYQKIQIHFIYYLQQKLLVNPLEKSLEQQLFCFEMNKKMKSASTPSEIGIQLENGHQCGGNIEYFSQKFLNQEKNRINKNKQFITISQQKLSKLFGNFLYYYFFLNTLKIMDRSGKKKRMLSSTSSFIQKLNNMLDNPQYSNIITWTQDQQAFVIKSVAQLSEIVLPTYFKHRNFSSFIRQLNMYNFNKIRHQEGDHVYMNDLFKKNNRKEFKNIKRRTSQDKQQIVPYQNGNNNHKGNITLLMRELAQLNKKQRNLDMVIQHLITDNRKLRNQNNRLWKNIQKTMNQSNKKLEKLIWFMLFGTSQNEIQNDLTFKEINREPCGNDESEYSLQEQLIEQERNTINPNLLKKIFQMLESKNGLSNAKHLIQCMVQEREKSKKKNSNMLSILEMPSSQPQETQNLCIQQNDQYESEKAEFQQLKQQMSIISDVNMFLNINDGREQELPEILAMED